MSRCDTPSDELLTGLIDGRLSEEERAEIELRLAADASLAIELSTLQKIRQTAAALPQPPSRKDLSATVLQLAAARAAQSGGASWIDRSLAKPPVGTALGKADNIDGRRAILSRRTASGLAGLAALAAGILLMLSAFRELDRQPAERGPQASGPTLAANDPPNQDPAPGDTTPGSEVPLEPPATAPAEQLASDSPLSDSPLSDSPLSESPSTQSPLPDSPLSESLASNVPAVPSPQLGDAAAAVASRDPVVAESMASVDAAAEDLDAQMRAAVAAMGIAEGFLLIIDVSLEPEDPDTADAALQSLLRRYDIAYGSEIEADPTVIQSLEQSRLVDTTADDSRLQPNQDRVDLFFVKARAGRLDAALLEMMADTQSFRQFAMDLAMDPPALELFNQLRGVQEAKLRGDASTVSVASPLNRSGADAWYGRPRQQAMPLEARLNAASLAGTSLAGDAGNPVSYALLVVRRRSDPQP